MIGSTTDGTTKGQFASYTKRPWYKRGWIIFLVVLALLLFLWISISITIAYLMVRSGSVGDSLAASVQTDAAVPEVTDTTRIYSAGQPSRGAVDAPIHVVEFSDFECPYCQEAHGIMNELLQEYPDKIYYSYRNFPLTGIHPHARVAALAGECAYEQGKFWEFHDIVFPRQSELDAGHLIQYAVQAGVDEKTFTECLGSSKYDQAVTQDMIDGQAAGVKATPTFFVNGVMIEGVIPLTAWQQAIQQFIR